MSASRLMLRLAGRPDPLKKAAKERLTALVREEEAPAWALEESGRRLRLSLARPRERGKLSRRVA